MVGVWVRGEGAHLRRRHANRQFRSAITELHPLHESLPD
jgi:hypothetical protein